MADSFTIKIDPAEFNRLSVAADSFGPALKKELRAGLRELGKPSADEVKKTLRQPSPAGGPNSGTGRAALIAATRVGVSFSKGNAGVKITTAASRLPAEHKGLLNAYNTKSFRHPVFGGDAWVTQQGRPYFRPSILRVLDKDLVPQMEQVLEKAIKSLGGRIR